MTYHKGLLSWVYRQVTLGRPGDGVNLNPYRFSKWLHLKDQALASKQLWVSQLRITFHNNNQVLIKNCCYGNSRFTTCPPDFGHYL